MAKKLYYKFNPNNGEPWIIDDNMDNLIALIRGEMEPIKVKGDEKEVELSITFVWLSDYQYKKLPEAY